jgi:hypothetical protein
VAGTLVLSCDLPALFKLFSNLCVLHCNGSSMTIGRTSVGEAWCSDTRYSQTPGAPICTFTRQVYAVFTLPGLEAINERKTYELPDMGMSWSERQGCAGGGRHDKLAATNERRRRPALSI